MSPPLPSPSSPRAIEGQTPHRTLSSSASRSPVNALGGSHRPSTVGSSYRDNVDVQRQMQQDIDSAMSMSRARSGSLVVDRSPGLRGTIAAGRYSTSPIEETPFGMLSDAEEREIARARHEQEEVDAAEYDANVKALHASESTDSFEQHRQRRGSDPGMGMGRKPAYRVSADGIRTHFDFGEMEEWAAQERQKLEDEGITPRKKMLFAPQTPPMGPTELSQSDASDKPMMERRSTETQTAFEATELAKEGDDAPQKNFHRRRARKQAQNNPGRRQGKLAMFENFGNGGGEDAVGALKAPRHRHVQQQQQQQPQSVEAAGSGFEQYTDAPPTSGHDRPYRFSFYSNALPVTIHARNICELPAEGQSFEDLFKGRNNSLGPGARDSGEFAYSGRNTPNDPSQLSLSNHPRALANQAMQNAAAKGSPPGIPPGVTAEEDPEAYTWWLDVLSPTDEEMRMLSKTFGIHPLTTEDILLEETREKIELFRTYYLVCFRSFDQDPYSQTYLEPLNMYIIVFREGTLSFHFRGTPHPQNVRRRIKHLKDYISVTSDWISYALIDDITDAFGPLIQSIEYEADSIDELVLILKEAEQTDMLRRIGTCRKKVMGLLRLMGSKADVVKGLAKRCNENWLVAPKSDIGLYLSDIQDHLITMTSNLNHYEKILSRSHSNYLAQISIEMTDANNQINDVLSKLTALGTVLIPMNLVTGLWGMNVHVPGQDIEEGYAWFGGILGALALFAVLGAWATYRVIVR